MHPQNARIIADQRWAELAHSRRRSRRRATSPPPPPPAVTEPGVGPDAFGFRSYLTAAEARKLAADWTRLLSRFADRVDDPGLRPDGAVPFELVVLGGPVPELADVDD